MHSPERPPNDPVPSSRAPDRLPERRVDNAELAEQVDTSDEWIVERTGIRSRYVAADGETTATLAVEARRKALEAAGISPTTSA